MQQLNDIYGLGGATVNGAPSMGGLFGGTPMGGQAQPRSGNQVNYGASQPVGLGFGYQQPGQAYGFPQGFEQALGQAAGYIGQGSQQAANYMQRGYEDAFRQRNEAISGGMNERRRRLGAEVGAQGLSPEMLRRQLFVLDAQDRGQIGEAFAQGSGEYNSDLAKLFKGTGTELAGLKEDELSLLLEMAMGAKARKAARKSKGGGLGSLLGTVAGSFLGPVGAAAGGALGGAIFGGGGGGAYGPEYQAGGLGGF